MNFYDDNEPFETGYFDAKDGSGYKIYYERIGNPNGEPVVFFHGGPGGGIKPPYRKFFDPKHYQVLLFDQRGAGLTTPHASLEDNTTWKLVEDTEAMREHFGIEKWIVFGGSWGSTLSMVYAETHPERVKALVLRGLFMCRKQEIDWFYQEGASRLFPEAFEVYREFIPKEEQNDLVAAYYKRLTSDDRALQLAAAKHWSTWEGSTSQLLPEKDFVEGYGEPEFALAFARIECHYFTNAIFLGEDEWILNQAHKLKDIPTTLVHGRYDVVCPVENAWDLKKRMPHMDLQIIEDAGHNTFEKGIEEALLKTMENLKQL
ncbi:MAG: prolyl aminopeptidase [Bdellovibrionales bacterium]|nr:prolyl aminopeptidase [Bdellovibrionales bacterium]